MGFTARVVDQSDCNFTYNYDLRSKPYSWDGLEIASIPSSLITLPKLNARHDSLFPVVLCIPA